MSGERYPCACGSMPVLVDGRSIYGNRPDLWDKPMWKCTACPDSYVGCHPGTTDPLGFPADKGLRRARSMLHEHRIDPLWQNAVEVGGYEVENEGQRKGITMLARGRVYAFLASLLGIEREACHTALFDIATCRRAWVELGPVTYPEIRAWAQTGKRKKKSKEKQGA
jgi:hypothetical protein